MYYFSVGYTIFGWKAKVPNVSGTPTYKFFALVQAVQVCLVVSAPNHEEVGHSEHTPLPLRPDMLHHWLPAVLCHDFVHYIINHLS